MTSVRSPPPPPTNQSSSRNGSSSAELWVSEEMEKWTYGEEGDVASENPASEVEEEGGAILSTVIVPAANSLSDQNHMEGVDGLTSGDPSHYEQEATSDSSFEDPAIVNMVRQRPLSGEGCHGDPHQFPDSLWRDSEVADIERENLESLFPQPSSESLSGAAKQQPPHSLPPSLSLLISLQSPPAAYSNKSTPATLTLYSNKSTPPLEEMYVTAAKYSNKSTPLEEYCGAAADYSNESTAPVSLNSTETINCNTPTLMQTDSDDGGLVMDVVEGGGEGGGGGGGRGYFPSAFERGKATEPNDKVSGDISNDITITSSENDIGTNRYLPVNCVSTEPVEPATPTTGHRLWHLEDGNVVPLSLDTSTPLLQTRLIHTTTGDEAERGMAGGLGAWPTPPPTPRVTWPSWSSVSRTSLNQFLQILLHQSQGNVEEAVSTALVSSVTSPTQTLVPGGNEEFFNLAFSSLAYDQGLYWLDANASSATSVTSESEMEGGGASGECLASEEEEEDDECVDDEEIARIMQEQLNSSEEEAASLEAIQRITSQEAGGERGERGGHRRGVRGGGEEGRGRGHTLPGWSDGGWR